MSLLAEIQEKCTPELIASRDDVAIAAALTIGRVRVVQRLGGIGLVLETLGPEAGAALLDQLETLSASNSALKWAWVLINRGELDFGSTATRVMITQLVPEPARAALLSVAEVPDIVSIDAVSAALNGASA